MSDWLKSSNTLISVSMVRHTKLKINDVVTIHVVIQLLVHSLHNVIRLILSFNSLLVHGHLKIAFKVPGHDYEHSRFPFCRHYLKDIVIQGSQDSLNFNRLIKVNLKLFKLLKSTLVDPWVFELVTAIDYCNLADYFSSNEVMFDFLLNHVDLVLDQLDRGIILEVLGQSLLSDLY